MLSLADIEETARDFVLNKRPWNVKSLIYREYPNFKTDNFLDNLIEKMQNDIKKQTENDYPEVGVPEPNFHMSTNNFSIWWCNMVNTPYVLRMNLSSQGSKLFEVTIKTDQSLLFWS